MKLAISNMAWQTDEEPEILQLLRQKNIRFLEIVPGRYIDFATYQDKDADKLRVFWNHEGFTVVSFQSLLFGTQDLMLFQEPIKRKNLLQHIQKIIAAAGIMQVPTLVFGSPRNRSYDELSYEVAHAIALEFFSQLAEYAQEANTTIALEPNAKQYQCNFLTSTLETLAFVHTLNHPCVKVNLDFSTLCLNEENPEMLTPSIFQNIQHIHISEPYLVNIPQRQELHPAFAHTLKKANYMGYVSIEMLGNKEKSNLSTVSQALDFVNSIYFK